MISEMLVDWLKHAFITKFNHIRPSVYERYIDVLCRDLSSMSAVGRRGARKVILFPHLREHRLMNLINSTHTLINLPLLLDDLASRHYHWQLWQFWLGLNQ